MSDFDSHPEDGPDRRLANEHRKLVVDIAATVDVEAGLREVLIRTHHADLVADLGHSLDIEAGLAAIVPAISGATPSNEPFTPNPRPADTEHVAATDPSQANAEQPELENSLVSDAASRRPRTPLAMRTHPVSNRTGFRGRVQALTPRCRVRDLVIAAAVVIVVAATAPTIIQKILPSAPTTTMPALDVLDYGVTVQSDAGAVVFTFTIKARGSGTLHYTWQPDDRLSGQPVRAENMTFTGPTQIKDVVYPVPYTCSRGQRLQGGMKVEITQPESTSGASYAPYDFTCR